MREDGRLTRLLFGAGLLLLLAGSWLLRETLHAELGRPTRHGRPQARRTHRPAHGTAEPPAAHVFSNR
jgi:hypothetical protein